MGENGDKFDLDDPTLKNYGFDYNDLILNTGKSGGSNFLFFQTGVDKTDLYYTWNNEETKKTYVLIRQENDFNIFNFMGDKLLNGGVISLNPVRSGCQYCARVGQIYNCNK